MKKFFFSIFLASVFFMGVGSLVQNATATFKSDERALALLQKARLALGGEGSLAGVNSLVVKGKTTRTFRAEGTERLEGGDMEIALQFPDKLMKMYKIGHDDGNAGSKQIDVMIVRNGEGGKAVWHKEGDAAELKADGNKRFIIKTVTGENGEVLTEDKIGVADKVKGGKTVAIDEVVRMEHGEHHRQNELLRLSLSLFLTAPQGMDVNYLYAGEGSVDGTACNIIDAQFGGASIKLYLGKDSNLPVMVAYQGMKMPMAFWIKKDDGAPSGEKEVKVFTRKIEAPEMAEFQVRFSDYRSVNGVLLPYRWTQTVGGQPDEIVEVSNYEINPANIADKFKAAGDHKVFMRKAKENAN